MENALDPTVSLQLKFGEDNISKQSTHDNMTTLWIPADKSFEILSHLKSEVKDPFPLLYDITAIDERTRNAESTYPSKQFTLVYVLLSFKRNSFIRLKVALKGEFPSIRTITSLW